MLKFITLLFFVGVIGICTPVAVGISPSDEQWEQALPNWSYRFPKDHAVHPNYKTEWWYFTGNLADERGNQFGYELTFFRQGVLPPSTRSSLAAVPGETGRFVQADFKFAHFAISDLRHQKFYYVEKINRGAFGEAGFGDGSLDPAGERPPPLAWIENWSLTPQPDGSWKISAEAGGDTPMSIQLQVSSAKVPVFHGTEGVSQKAAGLGNASHYYSFTRMQTTGTLTLGSGTAAHQVKGETWFDHEWASNQLGADQVGWDWFSCQFEDGTELMLYAMRRRDGSIDPVSSGTLVRADGTSEHLTRQDFRLEARRTWKSARTGAVYPLEWHVNLPSHQLEFDLKPRLDEQELALHLISYWEGAVSLQGKRGDKSLKGVGYMELTGYAGALDGLRGGSRAAETSPEKPPAKND